MTGIELITKERNEQLYVHEYGQEHDSQHTKQELKKAAIYLLTKDRRQFPENWDKKFLLKLRRKQGIEALKTAGAFIAAEIDRVQAEEAEGNGENNNE